MRGSLALESGQKFEGELLGGSAFGPVGDVVFDTSMTGITELITDPVYAGQALVLTNPLIGNCGVSFSDFNSGKPQISALIVSELSEIESNFRSETSLKAVLERFGIPAIAGVDTRSLVRLLRGLGSVRGALVPKGENVASFDTPPPQYIGERCAHPADGTVVFRVAVPDTGVRRGLARQLNTHGITVSVFPYDDPSIFGEDPDGWLLPDGPGDPAVYDLAVIRKIMDTRKPILATGLGHLLLAAANGAKVVRLPLGHRGSNIPVRDLATGKVAITSQTHGDAVTEAPENVISHVNVNDETVEGLRWRENILSVQFRPDDDTISDFIAILRVAHAKK